MPNAMRNTPACGDAVATALDVGEVDVRDSIG
jgi:hypothetical protein